MFKSVWLRGVDILCDEVNAGCSSDTSLHPLDWVLSKTDSGVNDSASNVYDKDVTVMKTITFFTRALILQDNHPTV